MGLHILKVMQLLVACVTIALPDVVGAQTSSAPSKLDKFDLAVSTLRTVQSRYGWCAFVAEIDGHTTDRDGKNYSSHEKVKGELADSAFAFEIDRDPAEAPADVDVPLIKVTFDGLVQTNLETPRTGNHSPTLGYHQKDSRFTDLYGFWPIFGIYEFSTSESLADVLLACRRREAVDSAVKMSRSPPKPLILV